MTARNTLSKCQKNGRERREQEQKREPDSMTLAEKGLRNLKNLHYCILSGFQQRLKDMCLKTVAFQTLLTMTPVRHTSYVMTQCMY